MWGLSSILCLAYTSVHSVHSVQQIKSFLHQTVKRYKKKYSVSQKEVNIFSNFLGKESQGSGERKAPQDHCSGQHRAKSKTQGCIYQLNDIMACLIHCFNTWWYTCYLFKFRQFATGIATVCVPGSSDPFYIATSYIKWVTTSWTHGTLIFLVIFQAGLENKFCPFAAGRSGKPF